MVEDKKVFENEKLDMETLEEVAGGTDRQMELDLQHFQDLGVLSQKVNYYDKRAIRDAFKAFGITVESNDNYIENRYKYRGRNISRKEAWTIVKDQVYEDNYCPFVR